MSAPLLRIANLEVRYGDLIGISDVSLEVSDFATVLQVGKSVLSGTAAALAQDPQVQKAYLGGA